MNFFNFFQVFHELVITIAQNIISEYFSIRIEFIRGPLTLPYNTLNKFKTWTNFCHFLNKYFLWEGAHTQSLLSYRIFYWTV